MNGKRTLIAALLVTGLVLSGVAIAQAQQAEKTQQVVIDSTTGKIVKAEPGVLVIRTTDGQMRFIMNNGTERPATRYLTPGTEVTVWHTRDARVATEVKFEQEPIEATDESRLEETGEAVVEGAEKAGEALADGAEKAGEAVVEGAKKTAEGARDAGEWVADSVTGEESEVETAATDHEADRSDADRERRGEETRVREELPATASWTPTLRLLGLLTLAGGLGLGLAIRWM